MEFTTFIWLLRDVGPLEWDRKCVSGRAFQLFLFRFRSGLGG